MGTHHASKEDFFVLRVDNLLVKIENSECILKQLKKADIDKEDLVQFAISDACDGYSGADLKNFLHQKIMEEMKRKIRG